MERNVKTFSIIIPTYKRADCLDNLLDDLEKQTFDKTKVEVVIVSEEVDEDTKNVIEKHAQKRELDLRCLAFEKKLGLPGARNKGMGISRGQYLIFLDDDVRLEENFLRRCRQYCVLDNFCFRVHGRRSNILEKKLIGKIFPALGLLLGGFGERLVKSVKVSHMPGCCFVVSKKCTGDMRFDEHLGGGNAYLEDADFSYSLFKKGYALFYISEYAITHLPPFWGGCREFEYPKWIYYYWNHKAYFVKKHGGAARWATAALMNTLECLYISILKRKLFLKEFFQGWIDGFRKIHR